MACKYLLMAVGAVVLSSLSAVDGKYRIAWITDVETNSGTNHWVGFEVFNADGKKTEWMWPNKYFDRGRDNKADMDEPSIGDIAKVNVHIRKFDGQRHQDDWNGYTVLISDSVTKKTYQFWPGHVDTDAYQKYNVREVQCKDTYNPNNCQCGTTSTAQGAFNMAKTNFLICKKRCKLCYPPDSDEPEEDEDKEDAEPADDDSSGEHEKKSNSHKKKKKIKDN